MAVLVEGGWKGRVIPRRATVAECVPPHLVSLVVLTLSDYRPAPCNRFDPTRVAAAAKHWTRNYGADSDKRWV